MITVDLLFLCPSCSDHLLSGGHEVELKCVSLFKSSSDFNDYVVINKLNAIIGIHAFRAGQLLQGEYCWCLGTE